MKKDRIEQLNRKITKIFHKKYGKIVFGHGKNSYRLYQTF